MNRLIQLDTYIRIFLWRSHRNAISLFFVGSTIRAKEKKLESLHFLWFKIYFARLSFKHAAITPENLIVVCGVPILTCNFLWLFKFSRKNFNFFSFFFNISTFVFSSFFYTIYFFQFLKTLRGTKIKKKCFKKIPNGPRKSEWEKVRKSKKKLKKVKMSKKVKKTRKVRKKSESEKVC